MSDDVVHITAEQLNANDESITIVEIFCEHGALVKEGSHVLTIETSKAAAEIRAPASGYIAVAGKVGTEIGVGKHMATIYPSLAAMLANEFAISAQPPDTSRERTNLPNAPRATVKAIELARTLGIKIAEIQKAGFIREVDVRQFAAQRTQSQDRSRLELTRVKKAAVKTLKISRDTIIPAYLLAEFQFPPSTGKKIDVFDLVIHHASRLVENTYPDCNAHLENGAIVRSPRVNFGFMVDVDGDLFMPVIRNAGALSLDEIAAVRADNILALFRGERTQDMLAEPTICASGLNGRHLTFQVPVVYPTTSLIIGINQKVVAASQTTPVYLTLAYDHQVLSGFTVSRFVDDLIEAVLEGL